VGETKIVTIVGPEAKAILENLVRKGDDEKYSFT
jgi:hypothetical protein